MESHRVRLRIRHVGGDDGWDDGALSGPHDSRLGGPTQLTDAVICPVLIGRKDLMRKFYPGAVGDIANAGSDKVLVAKMISCSRN